MVTIQSPRSASVPPAVHTTGTACRRDAEAPKWTERLKNYSIPKSMTVLSLVFVLICGTPVHAQEPTDTHLAPVLEALPSVDGLITWWLISPLLKASIDQAVPPKGARENEALFTGAMEKWMLYISPTYFVDLKPYLNSRTGMLWATTRIESRSGGKRWLKGNSYCAMQIYMDGQLVLKKPQPEGGPDEAKVEIDIPKGQCEITVGVNIRTGFAAFILKLIEPHQGDRAAAGDKIVIHTATGTESNMASAAISATAFSAKESFVIPGQSVVLTAGMRGSVPAGMASFTSRFFSSDETSAETNLKSSFKDDTGRNIWEALYTVPTTSRISHEISFELKSGERVLGVRKCSLYISQGLKNAAQTLGCEIQQRASKANRALPNAALAVEKVLLFVKKLESGEERGTAELGQFLTGLLNTARINAGIEEKGLDPWDKKCGYFERAYQSAIDDSPQPYFIQVPGTYGTASLPDSGGPRKKYPLIVFLHGYVNYYDKHRWWEEVPDLNAVIDRNDAFVVIPFARSNTDFLGCGEVDVLDVIAETKAKYPIDDDRVYLYGYSMGGMAVYSLAAHYPDLFAAGLVLAGRADSPLQNKLPLEKFHPYKQWLIQADNPISLCENFLNIPLRIYHGKEDTIISVTEAERMEKRLKELGCDAALTVVPGDHWFGWQLMGTDIPVKWLLQQKRNNNAHKRRMKSFGLRFAKQAEVQVLAATGVLQPIEIEWTHQDGTVEFTRNSDLILQSKIMDVLSPQALTGLVKNPQRCGPIREAVCGPFIIAFGTSGTAEANALNKNNAERFAREWFEFTRSHALIKADVDVTKAEKQLKNIFIFGEQQENVIHAAAATSLPIKVKDGQVEIGAKSLPLSGNGIMFIYPSPFANGTNRSLVICAGIPYGHDVSSNHKFDLLPDFLFYNNKIDNDGTRTNHALCAGFFDGLWKLDATTMWWFDK